MLNKNKVLILGNDLLACHSLELQLKAHGGMHVAGAYSNPRNAWRAMPVAKPDIILMDMLLRGLSGIECLGKIRGLHPCAVIVMMCSIQDDGLVRLCHSLGVDGFMLKPVDVNRLVHFTLLRGAQRPIPGSDLMSVQDKAPKTCRSAGGAYGRRIQDRFFSFDHDPGTTAFREEVARSVGYRVADFARLCQFSRSTLLLRFAERFGQSPREWLTRTQKAEMKRLLRSKLAQPQIAEQTGFTQTSNFSRRAAQLLGTSPSGWAVSASSSASPPALIQG